MARFGNNMPDYHAGDFRRSSGNTGLSIEQVLPTMINFLRQTGSEGNFCVDILFLLESLR
jgi:hypothetical protein